VYLRGRLENDRYTLPVSKEKLAEFLSTTRPSLSRELSAMVREGIIHVEGRTIRVIDRDRFQGLLNPL